MKVSELEKQASDAMFVILSDVHLDKPNVMEKLKALFDGYQYVDPLPLFIFIGNFSSKPYSSEGIRKWIDNFNDLANLIAEYPNICEEGRFVFVPGPRGKRRNRKRKFLCLPRTHTHIHTYV
jgi:DNA polymerase epsilon subunit 2